VIYLPSKVLESDCHPIPVLSVLPLTVEALAAIGRALSNHNSTQLL
jgi:hypothetical protein